jgi:Methyltransferase domain
MIRNRADFVCPPLVPANVDWFHNIRKRGAVIAHLVKHFEWTNGAELGLWEGVTTRYLLETCPKLNMIGVDLWQPQPGNVGPEGYEGWDHDEHERTCRAITAPFGKRCRIIKDWTHKAADQVEDGSLDFVFIDADHSEEGCERDIQAWLPKINARGWMIGHDINWPGVLAAVTRHFPYYKIGPDVVWMQPIQGWNIEWQ